MWTGPASTTIAVLEGTRVQMAATTVRLTVQLEPRGRDAVLQVVLLGSGTRAKECHKVKLLRDRKITDCPQDPQAAARAYRFCNSPGGAGCRGSASGACASTCRAPTGRCWRAAVRRASASDAESSAPPRDRSGFAWTSPDRRLRWGAGGVSGGGSLRSGLSTAVTAVHPDAVTPIPGATAPSPAVRRCANDGADVCSSGLLAKPHDARRGAGLLLPRAAAAGDGRLNHLGDGTLAPPRSHNLPDGSQRRKWRSNSGASVFGPWASPRAARPPAKPRCLGRRLVPRC